MSYEETYPRADSSHPRGGWGWKRQGNATAAIDFYVRAFGAVQVARNPTPDGAKLIHAGLLINGGLVMLCDDFPEMCGGKSSTPAAFGGSPVTIHLDLPDVDAVFGRAAEAGATVTMPLEDMFWGDRYGKLRDPFGHHWSLATRKQVATAADLRAGAAEHFPEHSWTGAPPEPCDSLRQSSI